MNDKLNEKCKKLINQKTREILDLVELTGLDECNHSVQEWSSYYDDLFCAVCDKKIEDD